MCKKENEIGREDGGGPTRVINVRNVGMFRDADFRRGSASLHLACVWCDASSPGSRVSQNTNHAVTQ